MRYNNNPKEDLKKNKPQLLQPILVSMFAFAVIVVLTFLQISVQAFTPALYIIGIVMMLLVTAVSWYYAYFSKKAKSKMLTDYEAETKLILEFTQDAKHYKKIEEGISVTFEAQDTDSLLDNFKYNEEKSSFGFLDHNLAFLSIGIGFLGLAVDPDTKEVKGIEGLSPKSIWVKKHLKVPQSKAASLKVIPNGFEFLEKTYAIILKHEDTYFDPKKNLICVGERKIYKIDDIYEFIPGGFVVLRDGKLCSLWIDLSKGK